MKRTILFAGTPADLVSALDNSSWHTAFASDTAQAMDLLGETQFDAVVADIHLPDGDGLDFLDTVMRTNPLAHRIVLSDSGGDESLQCVGRAHRHLLKPCDPSTLMHALEQTFTSQRDTPSAAARSLLADMRSIPSPPFVYFEVANELQSREASVERVAELISRDPAIAAKLLQLANSAVFGLQLQVTQPVEAVAYVGLETTRAMLLLAHSFSAFEHLDPAAFNVDELWRHSAATGHYARVICSAENAGCDVTDQAFTAGLLHDLGKLLFAANLPEDCNRASAIAACERRHLFDVELEMFGATHAEVAGALLAIWGLPAPVVAAVTQHHRPAVTDTFGPITAVHVANVLDHELDTERHIAFSPLHESHLAALGLIDRLDAWRTACRDLT